LYIQSRETSTTIKVVGVVSHLTGTFFYLQMESAKEQMNALFRYWVWKNFMVIPLFKLYDHI